MLNKVKDFIKSNHLLDLQQRYLIAVSGGADSVALLRVMHSLGYQIEACHCNFNLRGEESKRDEVFVRKLCHELNIELHLIHFDTFTYAELHKISIEMAARELRYNYFEQLCKDIHAKAVCVAHHGDDNVETVLLNLLRGTGIHGLSGIKLYRPISDSSEIGVVRPLLCVTRKEIEDWLKKIQQDYVIDSSNLSDDILRNQIRLNVIPLLQQMIPNVSTNLQQTVHLLSEAEKCYNTYIDDNLPPSEVKISDLRQTASALCVLYEWLSKYGFTPNTIRQIHDYLDAPTGRLWSSRTHHVCIDRGKLLLSPILPEVNPLLIPEEGLYVIQDNRQDNDVRIDSDGRLHLQVKLIEGAHFEYAPQKAFLDAEKVSFPITLRTVNEGDRFVPYGMTGCRLVSDFLTDLKVPITEKRTQLVVTDCQNQIVWVVGKRIANPYCITPETTQTLMLELIESSSSKR
jgi:tRNA(Ile)-lysidine synthase